MARPRALFLAAVLVIACRGAAMPTPQSGARSAAPLDSALYVLVLDSLNTRGLTLAQQGRHSNRVAAFEPFLMRRLSPDLYRALRDSNSSVRPGPREILVGWRDRAWIRHDRLRIPQADGTELIYTAVLLSRIGYAADTSAAVLFYEVVSGELAGGGDLVNLSRRGGVWRISSVANVYER